MKRRLFLLVWGLLLLPALSQAQQNRISGRVVDAKTKGPVPFASLGLLKAGAGALTNEKGYFQLVEPGGFKQDSLIVMTLGYNRQALLVEQGKAENLRIEMSPLPPGSIIICRVGPCGVASKPALTTNDKIIAGLPGTQYAFLIKNEKKKQLGEMRTVSFYIGENGFPRAPFRVRIYSIDGTSHAPSSDLLTENVLFDTPTESGWYTKDLSIYNIATPKEGYFVALEFVTMDFHPLSYMDNYIPSGQTMRPYFDTKEKRLWSRTIDKEWKLLEQVNGGFRRYNFMVKVEVELLKQEE